jgi:hypothetical protein
MRAYTEVSNEWEKEEASRRARDFSCRPWLLPGLKERSLPLLADNRNCCGFSEINNEKHDSNFYEMRKNIIGVECFFFSFLKKVAKILFFVPLKKKTVDGGKKSCRFYSYQKILSDS